MNTKITRSQFLGVTTAAVAGALSGASQIRVNAAEQSGKGFFRLARFGERWLLVTPESKPFFSLGLNHIDPSALRYVENIGIWRRKYGASIERWLKKSVRPDLEKWGFNSIGWVQEVVTRTPTNHRHSRNFTYEEYQWLGLPYCHMLPFANFHQWEAETRNPDLFSTDFEEWCDQVAREECAQFAEDPKLIGYFYIDCPTWVHTTRYNEWRGPLFDPKKLDTAEGRQNLFELASRYYKVTHDAIRRYDKNHLILGDRYEGKARIAEEVIKAAAPYVDVLSFQHFSPPEQIRKDFEKWHGLTGKPVILADAAGHRPLPAGQNVRRHNPVWYQDTVKMVREMEACVGFHLCGAYIRNRCRRCGLRDEQEQADQEAVTAITEANRAMADYVKAVKRWTWK